MSEIVVAHHPHPVLPLAGRSVGAHALRPGETVAEILLGAGVDPHQPISVRLDDALVPVADWRRVCPRPGQFLSVSARARGGDGESDPTSMVLQIGLMLVAPYAATAILGEITASTFAIWFEALGTGITYGQILAGAISMGGSLLLGGLMSHGRQLQAASRSPALTVSPTYSLAGGSNNARPYEPMLIVLGRHRVFFDYGGKPWSEFIGRDQYLYQIFHGGLSDVGWSDFRIGETPLGNYAEATLTWPDETGTLGFPGNVDSAAGGDLTTEAGWLTRETADNTNALGIDLEGLVYGINDEGGLTSNWVEVGGQYRAVGAADWLPLFADEVAGYRSHYWSRGYWVVTYLESFGTLERWHQRSYDTDLDAAAHVDGAAAGTEIVTQAWGEEITLQLTWRWRAFAEIDGGTAGGPRSEPSPDPAIHTYGHYTRITRSGAKPVRISHRVPVALGRYEVRLRRQGERANTTAEPATMAWASLKSFQPDTADYAGQVRFGLKIKATGQLQGTVAQLSAIGEALCNVWDADAGTWSWRHTRNPAWWYLDVAVGRYNAAGVRLYGVGLPLVQVDTEAIKEWAIWCDAQGLTCDAVVDRAISAAELLQSIARCGRASPSWATGRLGVVWDAEGAAVSAVFGVGNIVAGSFEVNWLTEALSDEIVVRFVNPEQSWKQDQVRVVVSGVTQPVRPATVDLWGCTDRAQAGRYANLLAAQQRYRRRRVSWETDWEGFNVARGDVVRLTHDLTSWGYSGRVVAFPAADQVQLDRVVPRSATVDYLMIRQPDGTLATYPVLADGSAETDTLTLLEDVAVDSTREPMDHLWLFGPEATPGQTLKVLSVQPTAEGRFRIIATDEDPAYYAQEWADYEHTAGSGEQLPAVFGLSASERLVRAGAGYAVMLTLTWDVTGPCQLCRVSVAIDDNDATEYAPIYGGASLEIVVPDAGTVAVSVRAQDYAGRSGAESVATLVHTIAGVAATPPDVAWARIEGDTLTWAPVTAADLAGYVWRWQPGSNTSWGDATPLHDGILTASPWTMPARPAGAVTLLVKATDTSGNVSANPAVVAANLADPILANVVETVDYAADSWPGTLTGGTETGGQLEAAADASALMWRATATAALWSAAGGTAMWAGTTYGQMVYEADLAVPVGAEDSRLTLAWSIAAGAYTVEYAAPSGDLLWGTGTDPMWAADGSAGMWSAPGYVPWPGEITASESDYAIRITTAGGAVQGVVSSLVATFDVPDVSEILSDVAISAGGTRLAIVQPYNAIKAVNLAVQDDGGTAITARVKDKDAALGPLIECLDAAGAAVSGTIDAYIQGY